MRKLYLYTAAILPSLFLVACHGDQHRKEADAKKQTVIVAKAERLITPLSFNAVLNPIGTVKVISPVDGKVKTLQFSYGAKVKKGQRLLVLTSKALTDKYRSVINDYFQKKNSYENGQEDLQGAIALHKAGLLSREDFNQQQTSYETNALAFYQSKFSLEKVLKIAQLGADAIEGLSIHDTNKINNLLQRHFDNIVVDSPASGVALFPTQTSDGGGSGSDGGQLSVGHSVKADGVLLSIGNLSGLATSVKVSELNINKVEVGLPVRVTGVAFPGIVLHGVVSRVAAQAKENEDGESGLSNFSVHIKIPKVDEEAQHKIHVGMTAKVDIEVKSPLHVILPLNAVHDQNGEPVVTVINEKTGQPENVSVTPGRTTANGVVILSGVHAGQKVVIDE